MESTVSNHRRKKTAAHFSMVFLFLFVPVYRELQWQTVTDVTSSVTKRMEEPLQSSSEKQVPTNVSTNKDSFLPKNIADTKQVPCGKEKCFFQLRSNAQLGYLVSRAEDRDDRRERFETLQAGWHLAQHLKNKYNIHHFLLAPPQNITVSAKLEQVLNRNLWSEKRGKRGQKRFRKGSTACIQKVAVAPEQTLLLGCSQSKILTFQHHLSDFIRYVKYPESFRQRAQENLAVAHTLLRNEPCLIKDFQVLLDTKGQVFHLDFDRCFMPDNASHKYDISRNETEYCMHVLDDLERQLLEHSSTETLP